MYIHILLEGKPLRFCSLLAHISTNLPNSALPPTYSYRRGIFVLFPTVLVCLCPPLYVTDTLYQPTGAPLLVCLYDTHVCARAHTHTHTHTHSGGGGQYDWSPCCHATVRDVLKCKYHIEAPVDMRTIFPRPYIDI